jgi:phosphatidylinositol-3-phosphatase
MASRTIAAPTFETTRSAGRILAAAILCALGLAGCGIVTVTNNPPPGGPGPCTAPLYDSTLPFPLREKHALIVTLENYSYESVFGSANMPYLNSLAHKYAYASGYFANTHPSLPNYFFLTAGQAIVDNDTATATVFDDNIVRQLILAGKTWREYSEGLPSVGYDGSDVGKYVQHHNPLSFFSDVRNDSSQLPNLVPFSQISADLAGHALPDYAFVVPDSTHDAHSCLDSQPNCTDAQKLAAADSWLQQNIGPLIDSTDLSQPGSGVVIILFDESDATDTQMGGGHVLWVVAGADVKKGFVAPTCYQHSSTLRFMASLLGLPNPPGGAATAPDMREFLLGN